ncbi:MAG: restriction endonuclease subunit S [Pseudomonadota bacterium]
MTDLAELVAGNIDIWTGAIQRKSGAGRGGGKRIGLYGIERLRALILDLAVRGKLVRQDAGDEPAAALLPKMAAERQRRIKAREIKAARGPTTPSSKPFDLPSGWVWLPLGQTGNIFTGNSINSSLRSELATNSEGRPFVATKDVGYGLDPVDYDNGLTVALDDQRFNVARPHSVFICAEGGSAGRKIAVSDREISFGNKLIANEPWSQIEPRYVLYTYLSDFFFDCFSKDMTGIIGGISRAKFLELPFPLPPLAEQRRIVAKVDELMALCDALERESADSITAHQGLVENLLATLVDSSDATDLSRQWARLEGHFDTLFTTDASIDALKKRILDLAVRGKLVQQDAEDEEATVLLKKIKAWQAGKLARRKIRLPRKPLKPIAEGDAPFAMPKNWSAVRLGEIIYLQSGDGLTSAQMRPGDVPVFGGNGINGHHDAQNIFRETIVVGRVGFYCGSIHVTPSAAWVTDNAFVTHFDETSIHLEFLRLLLSATNLKEDENATAQPVISGSKVYPIAVGLPPLAEQRRIVAKVDALMALCDALKARVAEAAQTQRHLADAITQRAAN